MVSVMTSGGAELWYSRVGGDGPGVVLLAGATNQAILWEPPFTDPLVEAGYQVVTFDWRDVGLSTWRSFREHPYSGADFVDDVIRIIDDVAQEQAGFERVHLIGYSMGGMVAQFLAGLHPDRVASLTTMSSGYAPAPLREPTRRRDEVWAFLANEKPAPGDVESYLLRQWRVLCGGGVEFDEAEWFARVSAWVARGHNVRCPHFATVAYERTVEGWVSDTDQRAAIVQRIKAPTLVIHGDDDGMFTPGNAEAIAAAVPQASVRILPGRGHELFVNPLREIHAAVLTHIGQA
jgi:pimeloyl-ACP methyl ester carboxylesterase